MTLDPLFPYYLTELISYGLSGGMGYLGFRAVRAYERRTGAVAQLPVLADRLRTLEDALARTEMRLDETVEAQHFTTTLLQSRKAKRVAG